MTGILEGYTTVVQGELLPAVDLRQQEGFAWTCRRAVVGDVEHGRALKSVCEISGATREGYLAHLAEYHADVKRAGALTRSKIPGMRKPPRFVKKLHEPKPLESGAPITWQNITPGHWEGREYDDDYAVISEGTWIKESRVTRTGTVWSVADRSSAWWVTPDDAPGTAVKVERLGARADNDAGSLREVGGAGEHARNTVLRANVVLARGIFGVLNTEESMRTVTKWVIWHSDPACSHAKAGMPYDRTIHGYPTGAGTKGHKPWTPTEVALALTRGGQVPSELCEECIVCLPVDAPVEVASVSASEAEAGTLAPAHEAGSLAVTDVTPGGHGLVYTVGDAYGPVATADTLGPDGTLRVFIADYTRQDLTLTDDLASDVRAAVRGYLATAQDPGIPAPGPVSADAAPAVHARRVRVASAPVAGSAYGDDMSARLAAYARGVKGLYAYAA